MMSVRLFRVILPVGDLDRAAQFYSRLLQQEGGGVVLALYNPAGDGDTTEPRPNFEHVYFAVSDLEGAFSRAEGTHPFGNPLCFVDEKTVFTGPPL
jgi:hypothetical protein